MRFLPVSLTTILVELNNLEETLSLFASLEAEPIEGIQDMVPAARTIMIRFQPEAVTAQELVNQIARRDISRPTEVDAKLVEIPVRYDGEDLADVAELTGLAIDEVVRRHTQSTFTVAFCGFAPGFGYLVGGDPALHVPRRKSPRTRIPAGSVALAGEFSGVYPQNSPGGWQIIGTTPLKMWDMARTPPALFQPGYRVRFVDMATQTTSAQKGLASAAKGEQPRPPRIEAGFEVLEAPVPALFQDLGRFGQTGQGVSASGALDQGAFKSANRILGNPVSCPALEIAMGGLVLKAHSSAIIALTGAPCPIEIETSSGALIKAETYQPLRVESGDLVRIGFTARGARSYLAVRGGFKVEPVLGSAATDTLAVVGPEPLVAGAWLSVGAAETRLKPVSLNELPAFVHPDREEEVVLDVVMGPRSDWFTDRGLATLTSQSWTVTPQSNRVGLRLHGDVPLERIDARELPSEGTATGAIQVPHSGQPVLFLADHPLTGGYPVIATIAEYHLDLAGQLPVNAKIRFRPITQFAQLEPAGR
ncbi:5-oxoprolinase/urea amidolyase family protein [Rhizobium helianthi]|uniref:5-oxoprolinase/urea amidolyase family protein n=1 Tax=Rhizobium helianthi TaxID=1132695 RepID=A0ABW4M1Q2_9HYPH